LIAVLAAFLVVLLVGGTGAAMAADAAIPGDLLYPVDVFMEEVGAMIGLPANHVPERLDEARQLLEQGRRREAVSLLETALREEGPDEDWVMPAMIALVQATPPAGAGDPDPAVDAALGHLIETARAAHDGDLEHPGLTVSEAARELAEAARSHRSQTAPSTTASHPAGPSPTAPPGHGDHGASSSDHPGSGGTPATPSQGNGPPVTVPGQGTPGDQGNGAPPGNGGSQAGDHRHDATPGNGGSQAGDHGNASGAGRHGKGTP